MIIHISYIKEYCRFSLAIFFFIYLPEEFAVKKRFELTNSHKNSIALENTPIIYLNDFCSIITAAFISTACLLIIKTHEINIDILYSN